MPPNGRTATEPSASRFHLRSFLDEVLDAVLVREPVAAADGVVEVQIEAVVRLGHAGRAAFRRAGVAAHRVDLRNQRNAQCRIGLCQRNRRA
jgi:hypothetical protein